MRWFSLPKSNFKAPLGTSHVQRDFRNGTGGLKGTMTEFELNLIRQRSREAIQQKARRGELPFPSLGRITAEMGHREHKDSRRPQRSRRP